MKRPGVTLLLAAALLAPQGGGASEKQDLDTLRGRIEQLRRDATRTQDSRAEAADQLKESEQAISATNRRLRETGQRLVKVRAELGALEAERRRLDGEIDAQRETAARLLHERYVSGERDALRVLLSGEDPARAARELHYFGYIARAQGEVIRTMRSQAEHLKSLADRTKAKSAELAALEESERAERGRLQSERKAHLGLVERLSAQLRSQQREIATLERNERRLTEVVERIARQLREKAERETRQRAAREAPKRDAVRSAKIPESAENAGVSSFSGGKLGLPVRGEIVGRFGAARAEGGPSWKGIFIRSAVGQEVRAAAAGRVVFADWMRGFGNLLILDHGQGYLSIYGNNESLLKQPGQAVKAGEAVATVGATGGVEQPGLYFEVRHQGRAVDPLTWLGR